MAVALLDTNVLFASARDEYHDPALDIVRGIDHGDLPEAVITNYVVAEALTLAREQLGPQVATGLLDRLVTGSHFDIVHSPETDFTSAQPIFRQYPELSFVDATIAAYMDREGVDYLYSFDDDFDAVDDIVRLTTPDNPFDSS